MTIKYTVGKKLVSLHFTGITGIMYHTDLNWYLEATRSLCLYFFPLLLLHHINILQSKSHLAMLEVIAFAHWMWLVQMCFKGNNTFLTALSSVYRTSQVLTHSRRWQMTTSKRCFNQTQLLILPFILMSLARRKGNQFLLSRCVLNDRFGVFMSFPH